MPLHGGILVDVKLMNQIKEIDLADRTVTVGPGINMLKLNEELRPHGVFYPDDPASYPCSIVGGRIGTGGWSLLGARFGHTRDLVISMEFVLPTGEIIEVGDGGGRKLRKSSTGFMLKQLFMGHQGTLGIVTEATLELVTRPEAEFAAFFAYDDYMKAYRTAAGWPARGWRRWPGWCCSTSASCATCAAMTRRISRSPGRQGGGRVALYGTRAEVNRPRAGHGARAKRRRPLSRRRDLRRRLGLAPRSLCHPAARSPPRRPGRADVLALRGRGDPLLGVAEGARGVARARASYMER